MKQIIKVILRIWLWGIALILAINIAILIIADPYIASSETISPVSHGMILWASVYRDGRLSDVLRDRTESALTIYQAGGFERFFISGDDSDGHGEVRAIVAYLRDRWIPAEVIETDGAGYDTYDSMRRAKHVYGIDSMLIFTQAFHLSRSVYIARRLWIDAWWMPTDRQSYLREAWFILREIAARIKAFLDVEVFHSAPRTHERVSL